MIDDGVFDYIVEGESDKVVEKTNDALQKTRLPRLWFAMTLVPLE